MFPAHNCVPSAHNAIRGTLAVLRKLRDEETSACCLCRGLVFCHNLHRFCLPSSRGSGPNPISCVIAPYFANHDNFISN